MSNTQAKPINFSGWLTMAPPTRRSTSGTLRLTKNEPSLAPTERACKISVTVPAAVFQTPQLHAAILFDGDTSRPDPVEIAANVEDILRGADMEVAVEVFQTNEEDNHE